MQGLKKKIQSWFSCTKLLLLQKKQKFIRCNTGRDEMLSLDWNCVFVQHQLDLIFQEELHFFHSLKYASALIKHLPPPPFNKTQTACARGPRRSLTIRTPQSVASNLSASCVNGTLRPLDHWEVQGSQIQQIQLPHALVSEDNGRKTSV